MGESKRNLGEIFSWAIYLHSPPHLILFFLKQKCRAHHFLNKTKLKSSHQNISKILRIYYFLNQQKESKLDWANTDTKNIEKVFTMLLSLPRYFIDTLLDLTWDEQVRGSHHLSSLHWSPAGSGALLLYR